jgi:hypothetical protein
VADALEFLLRRRLLVVHELAGALGPGAFVHGPSARLGAFTDRAFAGIIIVGILPG